MSRRTKLIILAIFFVLLAIPAVYLAFHWHPRSPLRFRVVETALPPMAYYHTDTQVTVAVENVTSVPIYLRYMTLPSPAWAPHMRKVSGAVVSREQRAHKAGPQENYLLVPAHSTIHTAAFILNERVEDARAGKLVAEYKWMSLGKFLIHSVSQWMVRRVPKSMSRFLPEPALGVDATSLEAVGP